MAHTQAEGSVIRPSQERRPLVAIGLSALGLVTAALCLAVQLHARQWLGEQDDGTLLATSRRIWVNRGGQAALLVIAVTAAALTIHRARRRLGSPAAHFGFAVTMGAVLALPVAYLVLTAGNGVAATYLADRPLPGGGGSTALTPAPVAAPAVLRLLFRPAASGLPGVPTALPPSACARTAGATASGRVVGDQGSLLVVERVVVFGTAAQAAGYYAGGRCGSASASPGFVDTPVVLLPVRGVDASDAYLATAVATALRGKSTLDVRMRIGPAVLTAVAGSDDGLSKALTPAQARELEGVLAAAATG